MILLARRATLALAAVLDIALHARPEPVAAKALAARLELPPRHLEPLLQALVRGGILRGVRGPKGGYELARERRRITVADVLRASLAEADEKAADMPALVAKVVAPLIARIGDSVLVSFEDRSIEDLCLDAETHIAAQRQPADFTI